jgi:hypothetical protein
MNTEMREKIKEGRETGDEHVETDRSPTELPDGTQDLDGAARSPRPGSGDSKRADKESRFTKDASETRGSRLSPENYGRKFNANAMIAREKVVEQKSDLPKLTSGRSEGPRNELPRHFRPDRPLPERPTPQQMRQLARDPAFQGAMRDSPLYQKIQQQSLQQSAQQASAQAGREAEKQTLTKGEVAQLFRMRNKFEKKDEAKAFLRYEIAKARQEARQKVQALRYQNESSQEKQAIEDLQNVKDAHNDALKDQLSQKLSNSGSESPFEQILQRVLSGGKAVPELPESVRARFATKTTEEWRTFFANALGMNGAEAESQGQLSKLIEALFRGIYTKDDGRAMLVTDLAFTSEGEVVEHKYAQIDLKDSGLLEAFQKLNPGDVINQDLMKKLGDEFSYLQLAHIVEQMNLTDDQKKAIMREYRQQASRSSKKGIEDALIGHRRLLEEEAGHVSPNPLAAAAGDLFNKKERYIGPSKLLMYMIYSVIAVTVVVILLLVMRNF